MSKYYMKKVDQLLLKKLIKLKGDKLSAVQELYPEVKNGKQAAGIVNRILSSTEAKRYMSDLMDAQGISLINCNIRLAKLLEAKKPLVVGGEIHMVEDNNTQTENLKTAYKLHKVLQPDTTGVSIDARQINVSIDTVGNDRLKQISEELAKLNEELGLGKDRAGDSRIVEGQVVEDVGD